ncbi:response regulator [Pseudomonas sp. D47]|uniref:response regulator n=1 Tax=Pseudomonas sp. D47 TaxID=3159447 RepID=UPI00387AC249
MQIVDAQSLADAFSLLANGRVDACVSTLVSARYLIARNYPDQLKINATVGARAAQLAFAVDHTSPVLLSILNKSLLSISPEEMDELTNRWRSPVVLDDSYWSKHKAAILQGFALAAVLLLSACVWIVLLRRQVLRRKLAERALSARLEFDRVLINGTPHPTYVRDRQGRLLLYNKAYRQVFGVEDERQLLGTTVMQSPFFNEEQAQAYHHDYLAVMAADEPLLRDRLLVLPSGEVLTIYHWILPFRGSEGSVDGLIGGWVDISDRQRLMEQLHAAKQEADNANRAKTTFLATMSHEIRTPMNAVLGMLEMAARKSDQGIFDRAAIDVASGAAKELLALIGDVLDIARIESGRQNLTLERANPHQLLNSVTRVFDGLAREKAIALTLKIDPALDRNVLIDAMRFKQIIANLLSNAIKFTAAGEVRISAHAQSADATQPMQLSVSIVDTGVGICEADQQQLFSPFSQAGKQQQGSGLGLVISRSLIEMMGGSLALTSTPAKGTQATVRLVLPAADAPSPQAHTPLEITPGLPLSVLIVDDYAANRLVLSQQLAYLGHDVQEASGGAQALALWNEQPFDVVVTDCDMPGMNGYQLAQAIRQAEQSRGEPSCLLLGFTANAVAEEKQRCLEAGMDDCLFKPISLEQLSARLQQLQTEYFDNETSTALTAESLDDQLKTLILGKLSALQTLREKLLASTRADLREFNELLARDDRQRLAHLAHRVKGGARLIRYEQLTLTCENLEANCAKGVGRGELSASTAAVTNCMQQLLELLQEPPIQE